MASCSSDSIPYSLRRRRTAGIDHSGRVSPATQKIRGGRDGGSMHIPHAVDGLAMCVYEETVIGTVFSPAPGPSLPRDCLDVPFQTCAKKKYAFVWQCCYCAYPSIPYKATACPSCGYGRCANCLTSKVQLK